MTPPILSRPPCVITGKGAFLRSHRPAGFSLLEMLIVLALLLLFAAASITTLMVSNQSAMTSRNQTLARAVVTERVNAVVNSTTAVTDTTDEPVILWQIDDDGQSVQVDGELDVEVLEDSGGVNTERILVRLNYTFAGRDIVYEMSTLRVQSTTEAKDPDSDGDSDTTTEGGT